MRSIASEPCGLWSRSTASRWTGTTGTISNGPTSSRKFRRSRSLPVWISEVGVSTFGAEEVQEFGLRRTAELLIGTRSPHPLVQPVRSSAAWPATTRHREAEGSSYYRHFYMGLIREDGAPKLALQHFHEYTPAMGICQWFHFEDHRLEMASDGCAIWASNISVPA